MFLEIEIIIQIFERKVLPDERFKKAWGKNDKLHYLALFLAK